MLLRLWGAAPLTDRHSVGPKLSQAKFLRACLVAVYVALRPVLSVSAGDKVFKDTGLLECRTIALGDSAIKDRM